jgi:2-polyprenyl-6-methoxyphenol hydroxylase-like FAD-dependent oxidoreductase
VAEATMAVRCCIVGGGPAGMMLGLLLARAGIDVLVLEKHADFLRDFRGDTIHPSTLEVMHELGLLDRLLALPHQKTPEIIAQIGTERIPVADFRHLPVRCGYIAFMPQWDFLDFLAREAKAYPSFRLWMRSGATALVEEEGRTVGVEVVTPEGPRTVRADLVVACDGRSSILRAAAQLPIETLGAPMDVLWFALPRIPSDTAETTGRFDAGSILAMINRGAHWQCGYVIAKGSVDALRAVGLPRFRDTIARLMPFVADRVSTLASWDDIQLLTVRVDRLRQWSKPGLLCIGDAAHAMSPVGGVGINLAIQDAVAAANLLIRPLLGGVATAADLAKVQVRREMPTRVTQRLQVAVQNRIIRPVLAGGEALSVPLALRLLQRLPLLRRLPGRLIGMGVRPEHVALPP